MIETKEAFNLSELADWLGQLTNKKCHFCQTNNQSGHILLEQGQFDLKQFLVEQTWHAPFEDWPISLTSSDFR